MFVNTAEMDGSQSVADDIAASGGEILSQEGTLLFAAFDSAVAAARVVTAKPRAWRVGISSGDLLFEDGLYHGSPLSEARLLHDHAESGEVLCTDKFQTMVASDTVTAQDRGTLSAVAGQPQVHCFALLAS